MSSSHSLSVPSSSSSVSSLSDLLLSLSERDPLLPDSLVDYFLSSSGCDLSASPHLPRLVGLAAEKFLYDIAQTAKLHAKMRDSQGENGQIHLTVADLNFALQSSGSSALIGKYEVLVDVPAAENERKISKLAKQTNNEKTGEGPINPSTHSGT
jgi:hypothetical protein